ncbi:MAG: hypothetical protein KFF77_04335 [Bacteroidetes bacterium]|nr:hypothetical protein [Bacteroidota bacterium]
MHTRRLLSLILFVFCLPLPRFAEAGEVQSLIARGDSAQLAMDTQAALRFFREAERRDADNPEVLWRLSKVHTNLAIAAGDETAALRETERAISYARRAVERAPRHTMAHAMLAVAYGQKAAFAPNSEKMDLSKLLHTHARTALEIDGSNTVAMLVLGIWHRELASLSWVVRLLLKAAYGDVPEASLEDSKRLLSRVVQLQPRGIMARIELAKTLVELDEEEDALRHLRTAVSLPAADVHDPRRIDEARRLIKELS